MGIGALAGRRVSLRAIAEGDLGTVAAWYSEAASAAYEERSLEEVSASVGKDQGVFVIMQTDGEEPIGLLEHGCEGEWLTVAFIALAKAYRGWGYGSEAVRLAEEWAVHEGIAERFRAEVDVRNGLGLYFWLRLGYRPASAGEFDWQREDARDKMPMVRAPDNV